MKYLTGLSSTCISAATCLLLLQGIAPEARAESTVDGYSHIVKQAEAVAPLGPNLFGDSVNMMDGSTEFHVTDVVVPSNVGIPVSIGRRLRVDAETMDQQNRMAYEDNAAFGYFWALDVPVMYGTFDARYGWSGQSINGQLGAPQNPARCTQAGNGPPPVNGVGQFYSVAYNTEDYFSGITISVPGGGSEQLLNFAGNVKSKTIAGKTYYGTTKSNWLVGCTPSLSNANGTNGQGEGFVVTLPNGTTYRFDWMAWRAATYVIDDNGCASDVLPSFEGIEANAAGHFQSCNTSIAIPRDQVFLYATQATDRFGNTVTYTYDPANPEHLTQIKASDGAEIDLTYGPDNHVQTITAGGHVWTYTYAGTFPAIKDVTLPDGSKWSYDYGTNIFGVTKYNAKVVWGGCRINIGTKTTDLAPGPYESNTITMTSPSGATGIFDFRAILHGTRAAESGCSLYFYSSGPGANPVPHVAHPSDYQTASLVKKTISGLGIPTEQWTYSYKPSWVAPYQSETTVVDSLGNVAYYLYGNDTSNFGQLFTESHSGRNSDGSLSLLRSISNEYVTTAAGQNFPDTVGTLMEVPGRFWGGDLFKYNRPLKKATISQQGATFTKSVNTGCIQAGALCFDSYARPLSVTRSSSLGYSNVDTTEYSDNDVKWVRDQVSRQTTNGIEVSKTDFDSTTALPLRTYAFGKLAKSLTYNLTAGSDQTGTIATIADGKGNTTIYSAWKRGVPGTTKFPGTAEAPSGATQLASINDDGTIADITDENGFKTCYGYDAMSRVNKITYPSESQLGVCDATTWAPTTITFNGGNGTTYGVPAGNWRQTTLTGNGRHILVFDALWRPIVDQTLDLGNVANTTTEIIKRYDASGRLVFQSYPMNTGGQARYDDVTLKGTHTTYDALDRVASVSQDSELDATLGHPLITTASYLSGFQTKVTNPRGYSTTTSYAAWDSPSTDFPTSIVSPEGEYTNINRDAFGAPTLLQRHDSTGAVRYNRSYFYNAYHELCRTVEPEALTTTFGYDAAGNLAWSAAGLDSATACDAEGDTPEILARKVVRSYDARNRLTGLSFADGQSDTTYSYTPDGLLATAIAVNGGVDAATTTYGYNKRRLMVSERLVDNALNWPITYAYDTNGHLSSQNWHGLLVDYAPNALGQPTKAGTFASGVSFYPNGALKQFTYGNAIVHTMWPNTRGLPDRSQDTFGGVTVLDDSYDYDANGNVAAISDALSGNHGNRTMTYDGLDRLATAVAPMMYGNAAYGYDIFDNLTSVAIGGNSGRNQYYCYDARLRLTNIKTGGCGGATVVGLDYDVQGNVNHKNGVIYNFDQGNRLRSIGDNITPVTSSYLYDGFGSRIRDTTTGAKYSQYTHTGELAMTADARLNKVDEYIYLAGSLIAIRERDVPTNAYTVKYQHTDALGSPVAVTDPNRNVTEHTDYEPYGAVINRPLRDAPGYTGHVEDAATGLDYMQQRYYDPLIGRFLSVDPVGANGNTGGNFNRYWYANSSPYTFKDPDGRQSFGHLDEDQIPWWNVPAQIGNWFAKLRDLSVDSAYGSYSAGRDALSDHLEKGGRFIINLELAAMPAMEGGALLEWGAAPANALRSKVANGVISEAGEIRFSQTAAASCANRAYVTPLSVRETILGGTRVPDPQGVPGRFMYTVDAAYNKGVGKFEVLVNEYKNLVEHAVYKSDR